MLDYLSLNDSFCREGKLEDTRLMLKSLVERRVDQNTIVFSTVVSASGSLELQTFCWELCTFLSGYLGKGIEWLGVLALDSFNSV